MKKHLLFISLLFCLSTEVMAQPATYAMPVSIGRNNCGSSSGAITLYSFPGVTARSYDSTYFFNYVSPNLTRNTLRSAYYPRLRIGNGTYASSSPSMTARDRFTINAASVSFNPRDGKLYYLWTDYSAAISPTLKTYVWRWNPDTTFSTASFNNPVAGILIDTLASFAFDIGGITFDNTGNAWQLEFSSAPAPYKSRMRKIDFVTRVIDPVPDTLDLIPTVGIGSKIYNVASGDITLMPNGQMYYVFDNKLYTPDYGSYGAPGRHITSTYIDTIRRPTGATNLVGLAYGNGDLISSFSPGCLYRRIDPITGDTNFVNYTYLAAKGVQSSDMSQISAGLGVAKKLVSVTTTGTAGQYNVVYDVLIKNYGTTPLTNLQVYDSLSFINGAANLSNVSTTMLTIPPPPGIALNPAFNGVTDARLLQTTGQNLPNYPVDSSSFTVRINCRISNVLDGVVYNNSAVGYANGYKGVALRDSSTNGNAPDLNQNDKPDDLGEGQPTPFVIIITPTTPPCATLSQVLYTNTFGTGTGLSASLPASPSISTQYTGTATAPVGTNRFSTTNNASLGDPTNWISLADHTGDVNGRMLVVNADAPAFVFYRDTLPVACPGQQYSMSFWTAFIGNSTYQAQCNALGGFKYPKFLIRMRDLATGLTITQFTTANITSTSWQQLGMKWVMPAGYTNIIMELLNAGPGGCGNDFALDDVQYGICDPLPMVSASSSCFGGIATFTAALSDSTVIPGSKAYQWQVAPALAGPYANIIGANASTYTINPILASDTGKFYRVIIAAAGNIAIAACQYISPGVKLTSAISSVAPSSISAPSTTYCNPGSVTLTAVGGTLGTSANYQWGTGAVVGTSPIAGATNSTFTASPTVTTTYWVRIENTAGPCTSATGGTTVTITVIQPSAAPASITGADICNPGSTTLTAVGGTLGTSANYQWGTGNVVGTSPIGGATGSTLSVSPTSTTTYWVRIENTAGPCAATTSGLTRTVTVSQPSAAPTSVTGADFCNPGSVTLTAFGGTLGSSANYQWGTGNVVGTSPIGGANASTLTVSPTSTTTYWVRIENTTGPCAATTSGLTRVITVNQPSAAATSANRNKNNICPGISAKIYRTGGTLGTSATWRWYTGSPGGTLIGSGDTLTVTPLVTTTYYVRAEGFCNTTAPQSVTIFISCDIDKDDDGIPDFIESNIAAATANGYNTGYPGYVDYNNDFINDNFQADGDSDNDGNPNYLDTDYAGRVDTNSDGIDDRFDIDLDGNINMLDLDSDNDGIPDVVEANGADTNGDGRIDNYTDTDGDGLSQNVDANNTGANNSSVGLGVINFDNDAVPNFLDIDSDNDGIPDVVEVGGPDTNNDGKIDAYVDANNDGLHDSYINATALLQTGADVTADGRADSYPNKNMDRDFRPNVYDMDSDGDGIVDVIEAGLPDVDLNGIVDGVIGANGWSTSVSSLGALGLRTTDADGKPDYLDIDADDDGIPDNIEGQTTSSYKLPTLTDADGDGLMLPYDNTPAAFGGAGILVYDHDVDNTPDYRDLDTDADGLIDRVEGNDFNLNGSPDDNVTLTGLDTDGDGLDNRFDSLNLVTNIKGTSYRMGTNGSFTGDAAPGSRTTVQRTFPAQPDRDWRYAGYVLPVRFLNLSGLLQADKVLLKWAVIADKAVDHFEVERSVDNNNFIKTGIVLDPVTLNIQQNFAFTDDIAAVNKEVIYYRIKVIGKAGEIQYSNILVIRKQLTKTTLTIVPNPAKDKVSIAFFAEKESVVTIRLIDDNGKLVLLQNQKVFKGSNNIQLTGLERYSNGIYMIQVFVNNEVVTQKLVLIK